MPQVTPIRPSVGTMVLLVAALGCGDAAGPTQPGGFSVLEGAANGIARVGEVVRVAFRVVDEGGRPVQGVAVSFVVNEASGSVFAGTGITNAEGEAREVWTLGNYIGTQAIEARTVDQTTGEPRTLGRLELKVRGGLAVRSIFADTTVIAVGESYDLRNAFAWMDAVANYWIDSTFAVLSLPEGVVRDGYHIRADGELAGAVVVRLDDLTASLPLVFLKDVRPLTFQLQVTCTDPADPANPAVYTATIDDPVYNFLPYDLRIVGEDGRNPIPWPKGNRLRFFMEGTVSYGGRTDPFSMTADNSPIWVEQRPGYLDVESADFGRVPGPVGRIPALATPGTGWQGEYQMPVLDGVQTFSGFCHDLSSNLPFGVPQLHTATQVEVSITR